jgi:hypothetical protein
MLSHFSYYLPEKAINDDFLMSKTSYIMLNNLTKYINEFLREVQDYWGIPQALVIFYEQFLMPLKWGSSQGM